MYLLGSCRCSTQCFLELFSRIPSRDMDMTYSYKTWAGKRSDLPYPQPTRGCVLQCSSQAYSEIRASYLRVDATKHRLLKIASWLTACTSLIALQIALIYRADDYGQGYTNVRCLPRLLAPNPADSLLCRMCTSYRLRRSCTSLP